LQVEFLIETCKLLKQENIHIALDTAGVGCGRYEEILELVDLVLFDVKYADPIGYKNLTGKEIEESEKFIKALNESGKSVWIRQVFKKYNILEKIKEDGYFEITSTQINEFREARLMTKFDNQKTLPSLFKENKTSRKNWILTFSSFGIWKIRNTKFRKSIERCKRNGERKVWRTLSKVFGNKEANLIKRNIGLRVF